MGGVAVKTNPKIYTESVVHELRLQNEELMREIDTMRAKQQQPGAPSADDKIYICDDDEVYHNVQLQSPEECIVQTQSISVVLPKMQQETLSEQLARMEKMRKMDQTSRVSKERFDHLYRDSLDTYQQTIDRTSNASSSSAQTFYQSSHGKDIMHNFQNQGTPSNVSSARSSVHSNSIPTSIESIDEHMEQWNAPSPKRRLSALELCSYIKRKSSLSINCHLPLTPQTNLNNGTPTNALEQSTTARLNDPILVEEEDEMTDSEDEDEYFYSDDDGGFYANDLDFGQNNNSRMGICNPMHRQKTDSQILQEMGMELTAKLKAQSAESTSRNLNHSRLSSTFASHWINLKMSQATEN